MDIIKKVYKLGWDFREKNEPIEKIPREYNVVGETPKKYKVKDIDNWTNKERIRLIDKSDCHDSIADALKVWAKGQRRKMLYTQQEADLHSKNLQEYEAKYGKLEAGE